jgi:hypothetical protein
LLKFAILRYDFAFSQPATFNIQPATASRRTEPSAHVMVTMSLRAGNHPIFATMNGWQDAAQARLPMRTRMS